MMTRTAPPVFLLLGALTLSACSASGLDSPVGPSPFASAQGGLDSPAGLSSAASAQPGTFTTASVKNQTPRFSVGSCSTCGGTTKGYRVDFVFQTWPYATYDLQVYERRGDAYVWIEEHDISRTYEPAGTYELYLPRGAYKFRLRAVQQVAPGGSFLEGDWAEAYVSF